LKNFVNGKVSKRHWSNLLRAIVVAVIALTIIAAFVTHRIYTENLQAVNPVHPVESIIAIPTGTSLDGIAKTLKSKKVIRADWAFKRYVANKDLSDQLKAGTYRFNSSQDVAAIVAMLVDGKVGPLAPHADNGSVPNSDIMATDAEKANPVLALKTYREAVGVHLREGKRHKFKIDRYKAYLQADYMHVKAEVPKLIVEDRSLKRKSAK